MSYPNHYKMKQNRLVVLKKTKGRCLICNKKARIVHHKDFSTDNHSVDNLIPVCDYCHKTLHKNEEGGLSSQRYKAIYGLSLEEMVEKYGKTKQYYYSLHHSKRLFGFLKSGDLIVSSKYRRLYGLSQKHLSEALGVSVNKVYEMHVLGTLDAFIKDNIAMRKELSEKKLQKT